MKKNLFSFILIVFPMLTFAQLNFIGHIQATTIPYNANPYVFNPKMHQLSGSGTGPATNKIYSGYGADEFVNFTFDTGGKFVFLVYTTNGSNPNKSNGTSISCGFSTFNNPDRLWRCLIPSSVNTTGSNIKYIFYISDSNNLSSAWGRIDGFGGNQYLTTWDENSVVPYSYTVLDNAFPVILENFKIESFNNNIKLQWLTAEEVNNDYFEVQRSIDGKSFVKIGEVKGAGNSKEKNLYTFEDNQPDSQMNYYRLKQVDFGGKFTFSKIIAAKLENADVSVSVFPNPSSEVLKLKNFENVRKVEIYNSKGNLVKSELGGKAEMSLKGLQNGLYFIKLFDRANKITVEKILVGE